MSGTFKSLFLVVFAGAVLVGVFAASLAYYGYWLDGREAREWSVSDGYCNIAVIPIQGDIVSYYGDVAYSDLGNSSGTIATSGDWVEGYVEQALYEPNIQGILFEYDSYGGYAAPADQIRQVIAASPVPTIAYIRDAAVSAAYLSALGADHIVASPFSLVGSIGVTYSYLQNVQQNAETGLEFVSLSSGEFKDMGNPNKRLTEAERALYERDLEIFRDLFVDAVVQSRGLSREAVLDLADGAAMPGQLAAEKGLVDATGDIAYVEQKFAEMLGIYPPGEVVLCK